MSIVWIIFENNGLVTLFLTQVKLILLEKLKCCKGAQISNNKYNTLYTHIHTLYIHS